MTLCGINVRVQYFNDDEMAKLDRPGILDFHCELSKLILINQAL